MHACYVSSNPCPSPPCPAAPRCYAPSRLQVERWRRQRSFVVLVAEDPSSGALLGSAAVSLAQVRVCRTCFAAGGGKRACKGSPGMPDGQPKLTFAGVCCSSRCPLPVCAPAPPCPRATQPEAALPPPFPTTKPRRTYVSNIATLPQHRRKGVATALLRQCERQARLWRRDSLWLHVEMDNAPARQVGRSVLCGLHIGLLCLQAGSAVRVSCMLACCVVVMQPCCPPCPHACITHACLHHPFLPLWFIATQRTAGI